jgi:hypothetical protein
LAVERLTAAETSEGDRWLDFGQWRVWLVQLPLDQLLRRRTVTERRRSREGFVDDHPETEHVRFRPELLTTDLLRRRVGGGSRCQRGFWPAGLGDLQRDPEIRQECISLFVEQDVRRLDVTVDDPPFMSDRKRATDLGGHRESVVK